MAVNQLLQNLSTDSFSTAPIVKACKADWKVLDALTEELAPKTQANGKNDGLTAKNALDVFTAVRATTPKHISLFR
jgi:hypothetical protein